MSTEKKTVETTGHVWDDNLREYNNPLPRWWLWTFYMSIVIAVLYWFAYPSFPVGKGYLPGLSSVSFDSDGEQVTTHWNTRSALHLDMQQGDSAVKQREYLQKVGVASYEQILADPDMMQFARSYAKGVFGDYCAACHGAGGQGVVPYFPSLVDDDWLWGGTTTAIETALVQGRNGYMPSYADKLTPAEIKDVSAYVLSLSGLSVDSGAALRGKDVFNGNAGACFYCHGVDGKGVQSVGAANLTDRIWTVANVEGGIDVPAKLTAVEGVLNKGIARQMPAFAQRLKAEEIKLLTVYVHQLGGGR